MVEMDPAELLFAVSSDGSNIALVSFVCYAVVVFVLAALAHRVLAKRQFLSEYFLGSRGLGVLAFTFTYGATSASAGSFAGFPALIYTHGWILALWIASYMIVPLCGMGLLGKRVNQIARKTGAITLPELLERRFESRTVGVLATCVVFFVLSLYLIPQFKIASIILQRLLDDVPAMEALTMSLGRLPILGQAEDLGYLICLCLFAILTVVYTTFGGFRAVVWTDVLQGIVMIFGVVVMLVLSLRFSGGLNEVTLKMSEMTPPEYGEATFTLASSRDEPVVIPYKTWFTRTAESGEAQLFRLNQPALIPANSLQSSAVKVVRITTPQEIDRILDSFDARQVPRLPDGCQVLLGPLKQYAHGHGEPGVYTSGPGPDLTNEAGFLPLGLAISFFFYWALSGTGQPGNLLRLMAYDSSRTLRRSIACLSAYFALIYFPLVIVFCCARVIEPGLDQASDGIMPEMAFRLTRAAEIPWLAGVLVAAPFAAAMSTVDSFMLMISSAVVRDVYQRKINPDASEKRIKRLSYICTFVVGVAVTIAAINPPQFIQYLIVFAGGAAAVTFLMPMALALYWPRVNTPGVLSAMIGGIISYLILHAFKIQLPGFDPVLDPLLWGFATSLALGIIVTLCTPPPDEHIVRKFFNNNTE